MSSKGLELLSMMRKANAIQIGEQNTGSAMRDGKAKLLVLAADASDNARSRAEGFSRGRSALTVPLPYTKEELSEALGTGGCSMAALTDMGFSNALMQELCKDAPDIYGPTAEETQQRLQKARRRKTEKEAHERGRRNGKRRTDI